MKKIIALTGVATLALLATPAAAQVSGSVTLTGTVGDKCLVTNAGATGTAPTSFSGTVSVGQLDNGTTGELGTIADVSSTTDANLNFRVVCTTANPAVTVSATPMMNNSATPTAGYTNRVDYSSTVTFTRVGGVTPVTVSTGGTASSGPTALASRLAASGNNIQVEANGFSATGVLLSGTYTGVVSVTVAPSI